jgi:hypothetical protein
MTKTSRAKSTTVGESTETTAEPFDVRAMKIADLSR